MCSTLSLPSVFPEYLFYDSSLPVGHHQAEKMAPKTIENEGFGTFRRRRQCGFDFRLSSHIYSNGANHSLLLLHVSNLPNAKKMHFGPLNGKNIKWQRIARPKNFKGVDAQYDEM